jgi:hypothetical protein
MNHAKSSLGPAWRKADRDYAAIGKPIAAANFVVLRPAAEASSRNTRATSGRIKIGRI